MNTNLDVLVENKQEYTVISPVGNITAFNCGHMREKVDQLLDDEEQKNFYLDLSKTNVLSSMGIREIMHLFNNSTDRGGYCKLCNVSKKIEEILNCVGLLRILEITTDFETQFSTEIA